MGDEGSIGLLKLVERNETVFTSPVKLVVPPIAVVVVLRLPPSAVFYGLATLSP
jgi:hypothetical protein